MKAVAVGSENGELRNRVIFTVPSPVVGYQAKAGVSNTAIDEAELKQTGDGTYTQPTETDEKDANQEPPSDSSNEATPAQSTKETAAATTTLPVREGPPATDAATDKKEDDSTKTEEKKDEEVVPAPLVAAGSAPAKALGAKELLEAEAK